MKTDSSERQMGFGGLSTGLTDVWVATLNSIYIASRPVLQGLLQV